VTGLVISTSSMSTGLDEGLPKIGYIANGIFTPFRGVLRAFSPMMAGAARRSQVSRSRTGRSARLMPGVTRETGRQSPQELRTWGWGASNYLRRSNRLLARNCSFVIPPGCSSKLGITRAAAQLPGPRASRAAPGRSMPPTPPRRVLRQLRQTSADPWPSPRKAV
jgi:hypothetical protein